MTRTRMHNLLKIGGEGGDRTHGPVARTAVFETARFGHSRTSPRSRARELTLGSVIFQSVFFSLEEPARIIRARVARLARKTGRVRLHWEC